MTLQIITADALLPLRHGFFTRRGGASSGVFKGLNCGRGSSDQAEAVRINRERAAAALDAAPAQLVGLNQVHSARAVIAEGTPPDPPETGDALVTRDAALVISVLTADCAPVLFADIEASVVAAAHAGWRGTLDGILEATIDRMEDIGAKRHRVTAIIGPTISQRAYEVGPDFFEHFMDADTESGRFFAQGKNDRLMFDLPGYALQRLRAAGVGTAEWLRHCTYSNPELFFSYRRSQHRKQADYGRLISAIRA